MTVEFYPHSEKHNFLEISLEKTIFLFFMEISAPKLPPFSIQLLFFDYFVIFMKYVESIQTWLKLYVCYVYVHKHKDPN